MNLAEARAMDKIEIFVGIVGRAMRPGPLIKHLSHELESVELIYPFWAICEGSAVTLIDTGFDANRAASRLVVDHRDPASILKEIAIEPSDVKRVIVSHLHWDHFSDPGRYTNAEFVIQRADLEYFTGYGRSHPAAAVADAPSLDEIDQLRAQDRLRIVDGDSTITDSIRTYLVGGHTPGIQITVVCRNRRPAVIACDTAHLYWNFERRTPTSLINDYTAYMKGFDMIERLTGPSGRWFPGHDPRLLDQLQAVTANVFRLPSF